MGFLPHTGGLAKSANLIVIDSVLTDLGRRRLAESEGFKITQFQFGDDEIDYSLFDTAATTPTENQDDVIMLTPVLEAVPDSFVGLKHALFTAPDDDEYRIPQIFATPAAATVKENALLSINVETRNNNGRPDTFYTVIIPATATRYFTVTNSTKGISNTLQPTNRGSENACFAPETLITLANGNIKQIKDISPNDQVLTYNLKTQEFIASHANVIIKDKEHRYTEFPLMKFELSNGKILYATSNHPVYVNEKGWVPIGELGNDDELSFTDFDIQNYIISVEPVKIERKYILPDISEVYTLEIAGDAHNFFANGILAHNATGRGGSMSETFRVRSTSPNKATVIIQAKSVTSDENGTIITGDTQKGPFGITIKGDTTGASSNVDLTWQNVNTPSDK